MCIKHDHDLEIQMEVQKNQINIKISLLCNIVNTV